MTERPIIFTGWTIPKILADLKTQTRRIVKDLPGQSYVFQKYQCNPDGSGYDWHFGPGPNHGGYWKSPHGVPGDRLWVRETWAAKEMPVLGYNGSAGPDIGTKIDRSSVIYRADSWYPQGRVYVDHPDYNPDRWRPAIHMPRWASRINLEVTNLRVQRIQDISARDVLAEGVDVIDWDLFHEATEGMEGWEEPEEFVEECEDQCDWVNYGKELVHSTEHKEWLRDRERLALRLTFTGLWNELHSKPKPVRVDGKIHHYVSYPWKDVQETREYRGKPWRVHGNPYVWVYDFRRVGG